MANIKGYTHYFTKGWAVLENYKKRRDVIHEEICTYEVCMLAKEKGFPVKKIEHWHCEYDGRPTKEIIDEQQHPIINQSQLQRWLREEKGIYISVEYEWVEGIDDWTFYAYIKKVNNAKVVDDAIKSGFNTYELALEDALKYALKNLV